MALGVAQIAWHIGFELAGAGGLIEPHARGLHQASRIGEHQHISGAVAALGFEALQQHLVFGFQQVDADARLIGELLVELLIGVVVTARIDPKGDGGLLRAAGRCHHQQRRQQADAAECGEAEQTAIANLLQRTQQPGDFASHSQ